MPRKKVYDEAIQRALEEGRRIYPPLEDKSATIRFIGFPEHKAKYELHTRYEYWGKNGKTFTHWFKCEASDNKDKLEESIDDRKKTSAYKKMKLAEEFKIVENEKL